MATSKKKRAPKKRVAKKATAPVIDTVFCKVSPTCKAVATRWVGSNSACEHHANMIDIAQAEEKPAVEKKPWYTRAYLFIDRMITKAFAAFQLKD